MIKNRLLFRSFAVNRQPPKAAFFLSTSLRNKSLRGFTLIEIVLSIFILTVALVGIFIFIPNALKLSRKPLNETYITQLAQKTMEEIKQQRHELKVGTSPPLDESPFSFEEPYTQFSYRIYIEEEIPDELLKITVRVIWQENSSAKSEDFVTFISK